MDEFETELPASDYQAIRLFRYGGQTRRAHDDHHACLCSHRIKNIYYIVPSWKPKKHWGLVVGSECIKRFGAECECLECSSPFRVKLGKEKSTEICPSCCRKHTQCVMCPKKRNKNSNLCLKCHSNIKKKLTELHIRKQQSIKYEDQKKKTIPSSTTTQKKCMSCQEDSNGRTLCKPCYNKSGKWYKPNDQWFVLVPRYLNKKEGEMILVVSSKRAQWKKLHTKIGTKFHDDIWTIV